MNAYFEYMTNQQYRVKFLEARVAKFESGKIYTELKEDCARQIRELSNENKKLRKALAESRATTEKVRRDLLQVNEDLYKENLKYNKQYEANVKKLEDQKFAEVRQKDEAKQQIKELQDTICALKIELDDALGKNTKLKAQINRDSSNSSIPTSKEGFKKPKPSNNRETTGRKPGGQVGHVGHKRKKHEPTEIIDIPPLEEYSDTSRYTPTGTDAIRQVVGVRMVMDILEYHSPIYLEIATGKRVHSPFPKNVSDDVNYDGSVEAILYLLNNYCNVSIDKTIEFLSLITNSELNVSKGMVSGLGRKFAKNTGSITNDIVSDLLLSPVLNTDCTTVKVNGKNMSVFITANSEKALYTASEKKGHEGVAKTLIKDYQFTIVHDHELTFYAYASNHQECLSHVLRYLKNSVENEPDRKWNEKMRKLLGEMIHYRKKLDDGKKIDAQKVEDFEKNMTRF